jgi:predicted TIM-barrel fold metal-dependent hydrolase
MRAGFRVWDVDTHFQPSAETISKYLESPFKERIAEFEESKRPVTTGRAGQKLSPPYRHWYRFGRGNEGWGQRKPRHLGDPAPRENEERRFQTFMGRIYPTVNVEDDLIDQRIEEMDQEGVDTQFLVCSSFGAHPEVEVDIAFIRALHAYLDEVCGRFPGRFTSMLQATARDIPASVAEMRRWADAPWAVAVTVKLPLDYPIDHPDLEPIWEEADRQGLAVIHHSTSSGYPGERDLWDNPFLGRTASHPWGAMRTMAAFFGAGIMDRHQNLKLAILESGFGWIPFWGKRMEDQVTYMGYVAEDLKRSMWEYTTDGRFFAAVVIHEGEDMVRMVNELCGDHLLMFSSDYPHAESRFPDSVDIVAGWNTLSDDSKKKLFWDNAVRCFGSKGIS